MIHCLNCARLEELLRKARAKLCSLKVKHNIKKQEAQADQMVRVLYLCAQFSYELRPNLVKGQIVPWDDIPREKRDQRVQEIIRFVKEKG